MDSYSVLIVDDDKNWATNLSAVINLYAEALTGEQGVRPKIDTADNQEAADIYLANAPLRGYSMIVIDREYPRVDGGDKVKELGDIWLPTVRSQQPNAVIAIATVFADAVDNAQAIQAVRDDGADDFITKSLSLEQIFGRLVAASEHRKRLIYSRMPHPSNVLKTSTEDIHLAFSKARARLRSLPVDIHIEQVFADLQSSVEYIASRFQGPLSSAEKELTTIDLQTTINQELPYFEGQLPAAHIRLTVDGPRKVKTYESDFRDALREVLQNAVNALDETGTYSKQPITVSVGLSEEQDEVQVRVSDEGPGFSDEAIHSLYQPGTTFWKQNRDRHKGMGLYVAKRMMQAVGGDLRYAGPQRIGATMILSLRDWSAK